MVIELPFNQKNAVYGVASEKAFISFFEKRGVFFNRTKKGKGLTIIGDTANEAFEEIRSKAKKSNSFINVIKNGKKITLPLGQILPIPKSSSINDRWSRDKNDFKCLSFSQMNQILCLIFISKKYTHEDIKKLFNLVKPLGKECIIHFNLSIHILTECIDVHKLPHKGYFWLEKSTFDDFDFKNSNVRISVYIKKIETAIELLIIESGKSKKKNSSEINYKNRIIKCPITPNNFQFYRKKFIEHLSEFSYYELLSSIDDYEQKVENKIIEQIVKGFNREAYLYHSNTKTFNKSSDIIAMKFRWDDDERGKVLTIFLERKEEVLSFSENRILINHFGKIQEVLLITNMKKPVVNILFFLSEIKGIVLGAYYALENSYIEKALKVYNHGFRNAYSIIRDQLDVKGKEYLRDKFSFLFAMGGQVDAVLYFLDNENLKKLINHFKTNTTSKIKGISPVEKVITITTNMFSFKKSVAFESLSVGLPVSIPWDLILYKNDHDFYVPLEKLKYHGDDCTGCVPCEFEDSFFVIACSNRYQESINEELNELKEALKDELIKTYNAFHSHILNLREIKLLHSS